jgi:hypothetical protein
MSSYRRGRPQLERLSRHEGEDGRRHPGSKKSKKVNYRPSKSKAREGRCCSPQVGESLLPLPRGLGGTSVAPAGASATSAGASTDCPVAGASAPAAGTNSMAASSARGDGGRGFHLSEVARPPSLSSSSSDDEFVGASGRESPCYSCSQYSSLYCFRCSRRLILFSFARVARSYSHRCAARPAARARGVGGSDRAAFTVTLC